MNHWSAKDPGSHVASKVAVKRGAFPFDGFSRFLVSLFLFLHPSFRCRSFSRKWAKTFKSLDALCPARWGIFNSNLPDWLPLHHPSPLSQWAAFKASASQAPSPTWAGATLLQHNHPSTQGDLQWPGAEAETADGRKEAGWDGWGGEGETADRSERWEEKRVDGIWENGQVWAIDAGEIRRERG